VVSETPNTEQCPECGNEKVPAHGWYSDWFECECGHAWGLDKPLWRDAMVEQVA